MTSVSASSIGITGEGKWKQKTYIAGVVQTSSQVELLIWPPRKQIWDRSTSRVPTAECRGSVPISQLSLKSLTPPFSISGGTTVDHRPVQLVDIGRDVSISPDFLGDKLVFGNAQLFRWHEVERIADLGKGVRGQVAWEVSESRESDVLVRRPSIRQIPLETGLDKGSRESSVVSVHDQVYGGECTEGLALVVQDGWGDYSDPEGIEGGGRVEVVTSVGGQVVVVEGEFVGVPKEIEDASTEFRGSVAVGCGLGVGSGSLEVVSEDSVSIVWRVSRASAKCS
jgi:hypothetical protein